MEIDSDDQQLGCYEAFGDVMKNFKLHELGRPNAYGSGGSALEVIREFRSIAAKEATSKLDVEGDEQQDWDLEARFWHLFELLLDYRTAEVEVSEYDLHVWNSNASYVFEVLHNDRSLYELWLVIVWLQDNAKFPTKADDYPSLKWSSTLLSGGLKSFDLDFPTRSGNIRSINSKDLLQDKAFYKYIFQLLLAGKYEEVFAECKLTDNQTLGIIICGMQEYFDPVIDNNVDKEYTSQQGNQKRALWRRAVFGLSQEQSLDPYERAIYCFLAGSLPDASVLQELEWESELLLYLNQAFQTRLESALVQMGRVPSEQIVFSVPSKVLPLTDILNIVAENHPMESEHPIRVLLASIMLNTVDSVIHSSVSMLSDLVKGSNSEDNVFETPFLLRLLTHMTIVLDILEPSSVSKFDKSRLLTTYINILRFRGLFDIIPIYVSYLDDSDALQSYSVILSTMGDHKTRKEQIDLCRYLGLPISNFLRRTAQTAFTETESDYTPDLGVSISFEVRDSDIQLVLGVEWLIEGKLHDEAMDSIIAMSRRFLLTGRIGSLKYFMKRNNINEIIKEYELDKLGRSNYTSDGHDVSQELLQYGLLLSSFKKYTEWQKTVKELNSESNIPTIIQKFQEFTTDIKKLIRTFLDELTKDESLPDHEVLFEIRAMYVPYWIIELHKGLLEAAELLKISTFTRQALQLTSIVANESDKIYLLFQSTGKLKEYLQLVAQASTLLH